MKTREQSLATKLHYSGWLLHLAGWGALVIARKGELDTLGVAVCVGFGLIALVKSFLDIASTTPRTS